MLKFLLYLVEFGFGFGFSFVFVSVSLSVWPHQEGTIVRYPVRDLGLSFLLALSFLVFVSVFGFRLFWIWFWFWFWFWIWIWIWFLAWILSRTHFLLIMNGGSSD
jgi:hypothetical protein